MRRPEDVGKCETIEIITLEGLFLPFMTEKDVCIYLHYHHHPQILTSYN